MAKQIISSKKIISKIGMEILVKVSMAIDNENF